MTEYEFIQEWCYRYSGWLPSKSQTSELLALLGYTREADDSLTRALAISDASEDGGPETAPAQAAASKTATSTPKHYVEPWAPSLSGYTKGAK